MAGQNNPWLAEVRPLPWPWVICSTIRPLVIYRLLRPDLALPLSCCRKRCVEELKEFIPNIESKPEHSIYKYILYDLERFKAFKSQGQFSHILVLSPPQSVWGSSRSDR